MTKEFNDILIPLVWEVFGEYLKLGIEVLTKEFLCTLKLTYNILHVWARCSCTIKFSVLLNTNPSFLV